jgi:hypothetical protein
MAATLGWRMAMLLLGCAYLHGAIAGALMKPPPLIASTKTIKLAQVGKNADDLKGVEATNGQKIMMMRLEFNILENRILKNVSIFACRLLWCS